MPVRTETVSIQVVNPDVRARIRVLLDGKVIFDAFPVPSPLKEIPTVSAVAGSFALPSATSHELTAEVTGANTRAQLKWTPGLEASSWVVRK